MQCFHATVNRVKTRFPTETEVMNRETVSRVVFILFLDLLTWQILGNHFLMGIKIICLIRQGLKLRNRNIKWNLLTIVSMSFSDKLMLKDWNYRASGGKVIALDTARMDGTSG